jgi:hypothetical protein
MAWGKRKRPEIDLEQALNPYEATAMPVAGSSPTSGVASIRCWDCQRPNIYDARRNAPRRCAWCRSLLS